MSWHLFDIEFPSNWILLHRENQALPNQTFANQSFLNYTIDISLGTILFQYHSVYTLAMQESISASADYRDLFKFMSLMEKTTLQNHLKTMVACLAGSNLPLAQEASAAGMVTIKFWSELPTFNELLESSLIRFQAHDFLDGPRQ